MSFNDNQAWVYPPKEPYFPQNPAYHFVPYLGRPMGDESFRHTTVLSTMGRGPKGAKGDTFTYEDMTPADKQDIARYIASISATSEEGSVDLSDGSYDSVEIPLDNYDPDNSILSVYLNGCELEQGVEYTLAGDSINFSSPLVVANTSAFESPNKLTFVAINFLVSTDNSNEPVVA